MSLVTLIRIVYRVISSLYVRVRLIQGYQDQFQFGKPVRYDKNYRQTNLFYHKKSIPLFSHTFLLKRYFQCPSFFRASLSSNVCEAFGNCWLILKSHFDKVPQWKTLFFFFKLFKKLYLLQICCCFFHMKIVLFFKNILLSGSSEEISSRLYMVVFFLVTWNETNLSHFTQKHPTIKNTKPQWNIRFSQNPISFRSFFSGKALKFKEFR